MNKPKRIQRKRTKGWRMPANTVYVGRPTKWGNKFKEGGSHPLHGWPMSRVEAIQLYEECLIERLNTAPKFLEELRGKHLACWCPLDQPCHADVLLELANKAEE